MGSCGTDSMAQLEEGELYFGLLDGLFGRYDAPEQPADTCVVISTGIHQHTAIYENLTQRLILEGHAVFRYDHRGFGRSLDYPDHGRSVITCAEFVEDKPSIATD